MGKSRSATVVIAYMMQKHHMSPDEALAQLRESRSVCEPNSGFMDQLWLFHSMNMPEKVEDLAAYQKWLYSRDLEASRAVRQAPEAEKIRFEDEYTTSTGQVTFEMKCRKCRCVFEIHFTLKEVTISQTTAGNVTIPHTTQPQAETRRRIEYPYTTICLRALLRGRIIVDAARTRAWKAGGTSRVSKMQNQCWQIRVAGLAV